MIKQILAALAVLFFSAPVFAQQQHSLLYEVSGNGLKKSSYLFGTLHLYSQSFVDSQTNVIKKLKASKAVAGEIVTADLAGSPKLIKAMQADTPLTQLLDADTYRELDAWMLELTGMDMTLFNSLSPMAINAMLMQFIYNKHFKPRREPLMDAYIQEYAAKRKMRVYGLEDVDAQINALFNKPLKRQAEQLTGFVEKRDSAVHQLHQLLTLYRRADYDRLMALMYTGDYSDDEIKVMLDDRNNAWMEKLPAMMAEQPTFVAVGALHLPGETGLVHQLRRRGYTVTPLALK